MCLCLIITDPTANPTQVPTQYPTNEPDSNDILTTQSPTQYPFNLSEHPTVEMNPTLSPTVRPSLSPSVHPSLDFGAELNISASTTREPTSSPSTRQSDTSQSNQKEENLFILIPVIIAMVVVFGFCLFICSLVRFSAKKEKENKKANDNKKELELPILDQEGAAKIPPTREQSDIREWLQKISLTQYYDAFISNGYDSLAFIADITLKSELEEIGITKIGHQKRIFLHLQPLALIWNFSQSQASQSIVPIRNFRPVAGNHELQNNGSEHRNHQKSATLNLKHVSASLKLANNGRNNQSDFKQRAPRALTMDAATTSFVYVPNPLDQIDEHKEQSHVSNEMMLNIPNFDEDDEHKRIDSAASIAFHQHLLKQNNDSIHSKTSGGYLIEDEMSDSEKKDDGESKHQNDTKIAIEVWLTETVKLPIYSDLFVLNGYESMSAVKKINSETELEDIGISDEQHQKRLLAHIRILNGSIGSILNHAKALQHQMHVVDKTDDTQIKKYMNNQKLGLQQIMSDSVQSEQQIMEVDESSDSDSKCTQNGTVYLKPYELNQVIREEAEGNDNKEEEDDYDVWLKNQELNQRDEQMAIGVWLREIKLSQYYDTLINNGYDCMEFIRDITDVSDLKDIGITRIAHQKRIFKAIQNLQATPNPLNMRLNGTESNIIHDEEKHIEEEENESLEYQQHRVSSPSTDSEDALLHGLETVMGPSDRNLKGEPKAQNTLNVKQIVEEHQRSHTDNSIAFHQNLPKHSGFKTKGYHQEEVSEDSSEVEDLINDQVTTTGIGLNVPDQATKINQQVSNSAPSASFVQRLARYSKESQNKTAGYIMEEDWSSESNN